MEAAIADPVFITGITGTLGSALALRHYERGHKVYGCCLSEQNAATWHQRHPKVATIFDQDAIHLDQMLASINRAGHQVPSVVFHCAAVKHVDRAERHPINAAYHNIVVLLQVIEACRKHSAQLVFADSDKSCCPTNVYGASKLIGSRAVLESGGSVVRPGNLIGSSGSVFHLWLNKAKLGEKIPLTDPEMTRLFIPVRKVVDHMMFAAKNPGRLIVPVMKHARMGQIASLMSCNVHVTGRRPGERTHEWMIAPGERIETNPGWYFVGSGTECPDGIQSDATEPWDYQELVREITSSGRK